MKTEIGFNLATEGHIRAFAQLIRELNETGVPYEVTQTYGELSVMVKIGDGY